MMYLNREEEEMLNGEHDYVSMKCMEYIVKYGEAAGAERLVEIDGTCTIFMHGSTSIPELGIDINGPEMMGRRLKAFTMSQEEGVLFGWEDIGIPPWSDPEHHSALMETLKAWMRIGVHPTASCAFYLVSTYNPRFGQHCSWDESSAIPWGNAILGARVNFDPHFASAYLAKTPEYDMHLDENRVATRLVKCLNELKTDMDYDLFGWVVGEAIGLEVPVITGIGRPTQTQIIKMNTTLNTGGQVRMYHVPGLTPEASSVEAALQGRKPVETITVKREDLKKVYDMLTHASEEKVDFVYLGCPFYSLNDLRKAVYYLEGKKCQANLWITVDAWTFHVAEMMGYREIIKRAGGVLISGACACQTGLPPNTDVMATNAAKQNYYITGFNHPRKLEVWYGTTKECIDAAVTGVWRGKWPGGS